MFRFSQIIVVTTIAIVTLLASTAAASAATRITITGPSTTTASATNLTLSGSAIGRVVGNYTLGVSFVTGTINCTASRLAAIGTVTSGAVTVSTPPGATEAYLLPWIVNLQCDSSGNIVLGGSGPDLSILSVGISVRLNAISSFLFAGFLRGTISTSGTSLLITSSSLTGNPGGSSASAAGSFAISPAISYTLS